MCGTPDVVGWPNAGAEVVMEKSHVGLELDRRLRDDEAMDEIEMTSNLMIAASEVEEPLTQAQVDAILGL
jgi:hypothetical protein